MEFKEEIIILYRGGKNTKCIISVTDEDIIIANNVNSVHKKLINIPIEDLKKVSKSPGGDAVIVLHTYISIKKEEYDHMFTLNCLEPTEKIEPHQLEKEESDYIFSFTSLEQNVETKPSQVSRDTFIQKLRDILMSKNKTLLVEENAKIECIRRNNKNQKSIKTLEIICCNYYENSRYYRFFKIKNIIEYNVPIICGKLIVNIPKT